MDNYTQGCPILSYTKKSIVEVAEFLSRRFRHQKRDLPFDLFTFDFDTIFDELIYPEYEVALVEDLDLGHDADGAKIFGYYDPVENSIFLDRTLSDRTQIESHRRTFTAWHEVGHLVLHRDWLREVLRNHSLSEFATTEFSISEGTSRVIEQQANLFAAHAAAPDWAVRKELKKTFSLHRPIRYAGPSRYYLNVRGVDISYEVEAYEHLCRIIASLVRSRFGDLSIEALSYRIGNSGLVLCAPSHRATVPTVPFRLYRRAPTPRRRFAATA